MIQKLGIEEEKVPEMNRVLYKNYGTTMAGLKVYYYCPLAKMKTSYEHVIQLNHEYIFSPVQAIGYDFDDDDYHRYTSLTLFFVVNFHPFYFQKLLQRNLNEIYVVYFVGILC